MINEGVAVALAIIHYFLIGFICGGAVYIVILRGYQIGYAVVFSLGYFVGGILGVIAGILDVIIGKDIVNERLAVGVARAITALLLLAVLLIFLGSLAYVISQWRLTVEISYWSLVGAFVVGGVISARLCQVVFASGKADIEQQQEH